jgi:hypothetical protein
VVRGEAEEEVGELLLLLGTEGFEQPPLVAR